MSTSILRRTKPIFQYVQAVYLRAIIMAKRIKQTKTVGYKNRPANKAKSKSRNIRTKNSDINPARLGVLNALRGKLWIPLGSTLLLGSYSYAIGLQEIQVKSNLGEPLSAMVYLTNPGNKPIASECFTVTNGSSSLGMPPLRDASVRVSSVGGQMALQVSTSSSVREPISEVTIASSCASLPVIQRTYTLMLDPASIRETRLANSSYGNEFTRRAVANQTQSPRTSRTANYGGAIAQGSRYNVQVGDTLSTIAARISDRPIGSVWSLAAAIHNSNPQAFTNNNPNLIELGSEISIPVINTRFSINESSALSNLGSFQASTISGTVTKPETVFINTGSSQSTSQSSISKTVNAQTSTSAQTQYVMATTEALPTMTATTRLSALSLERIKVRASGEPVSFDFAGSGIQLPGNDGGQDLPQLPTIAVLPQPEIINEPVINNPGQADNTSSTSDSRFNLWSLLGLLGTLLLLGFASWKYLIPYLQRMARVDFINKYRKHSKKQAYLEKTRQRKAELGKTVTGDGLGVSEIEPLVNRQPAAPEPATGYKRSVRDAEENPFEISDVDIVDAEKIEIQVNEDELSDSYNVDSNTNESESTTSGGPRKSRVAKEIYEVGMIDDTGELVSLTTAFPELEAELNARLGSDSADVKENLTIEDANETRQTKTMEFDSEEFAGLQVDPDVNTIEDDIDDETLTIEMQEPLGDSLDLELPAISEDSINLEADFDSIAKDGGMSKTMIFNEEVFVPGKNDQTTLSTEQIDSDAETRVSSVLSDEDGLTPSDFGLNDDDFPVNREDYGYLEPDASIVTEGLNLTQEELEELGLDDDDNIIPFSPKDRKKSA